MLILEYAFFTPGFTKSDAILSLTGWRGKNLPGEALVWLTENGMVEEIPGTDGGLLRISRAGTAYLEGEDPYYLEWRKYPLRRASASVAKAARARVRVWSMVRSTEAKIYPRDKPSFADFAAAANITLGKAVEWEADSDSRYLPSFGMRKALECGIYYTADEVRAGCDALRIKSDTFRYSRFCGVLFTKDSIYVFYNTKTTAIKWTDVSEEALTAMLKQVFGSAGSLGGWYGYSPALKGVRGPICVFTGPGWAAAETIATGYLHGRKEKAKTMDAAARKKAENLSGNELAAFLSQEEERRRKDERAAGLRRSHSGYFSAYNSRQYREIYYLPLKGSCAYMMLDIMESSRDALERRAAAWFAKQEGWTGTGGVTGFNTATRETLVYFPVMECSLLADICKRKKAVSVATDARMAQTVSLALGPLLDRIYDIYTGGEITGTPRYDEFGFSQNEKSRQAPSGGGRPPLDPEDRKTTVSAAVPEAVHREILKIARAEKKTVSETVAELVSEAIEARKNRPGQ